MLDVLKDTIISRRSTELWYPGKDIWVRKRGFSNAALKLVGCGCCKPTIIRWDSVAGLNIQRTIGEECLVLHVFNGFLWACISNSITGTEDGIYKLSLTDLSIVAKFTATERGGSVVPTGMAVGANGVFFYNAAASKRTKLDLSLSLVSEVSATASEITTNDWRYEYSPSFILGWATDFSGTSQIRFFDHSLSSVASTFINQMTLYDGIPNSDTLVVSGIQGNIDTPYSYLIRFSEAGGAIVEDWEGDDPIASSPSSGDGWTGGKQYNARFKGGSLKIQRHNTINGVLETEQAIANTTVGRQILNDAVVTQSGNSVAYVGDKLYIIDVPVLTIQQAISITANDGKELRAVAFNAPNSNYFIGIDQR